MLQEEPFWSVMIPTYNPESGYLRQALESVLQQDPGGARMQIEVVDDCSARADVRGLLQQIAGDRVTFSRTPQNLGLAGCWNTCVERARGRWVHLLHQDDLVLPGFYEKLAAAAARKPDVALLATRNFFVDADGIIFDLSRRLPSLENGSHSVDDFFRGAPFQCAGVAVRRAFYREYGGFRSDLAYTVDVEMWARVISTAGGLVLPEILASFRRSPGSETSRLERGLTTLYDYQRLHKLFAKRYPGFDLRAADRWLNKTALGFWKQFRESGDAVGARNAEAYWKKFAPWPLRVRTAVVGIWRRFFGYE